MRIVLEGEIWTCKRNAYMFHWLTGRLLSRLRSLLQLLDLPRYDFCADLLNSSLIHYRRPYGMAVV